MTPIGHSFTGLAIGYAVMPRSLSPREKSVTLAIFAVLANAPDLPVPGWGHDRYRVSHSAFVTAVAALAAAIVVGVLLRRTKYFCWPLLIGGVLAWFSHLFLDMLYNHGRGLLVGWPFGVGRVAFPVPWFSTMDRHDILGTHNFSVWTIEAAVYGTFLAAVVIIRRIADNRSLAKTK